MYVSMLLSPYLPPSPSPDSCVHNSVLHVCVSIDALQIGSSVPSFQIPYICVAAVAAKSFQSCPTLCDHIDGSPLGSPVPGILQARTLEWAAISFSNAWKWRVKGKLISRFRLCCDPMDCSPPGSSIHGIFQARVLEWGAVNCFSLSDLLQSV